MLPDTTASLSSQKAKGQLLRDVVVALLLPAVLLLYHVALRRYLGELDRPWVLELGFLSSLGVACVYEFKDGLGWRAALIGCLVSAMLFAMGAWAAHGIRIEYMAVIDEIRDVPGLVEWMGRDLHAALTTRMVGYAGCFALGLLGARLVLGGLLRRTATRLLVTASGRTLVCPCCAQRATVVLGTQVIASK